MADLENLSLSDAARLSTDDKLLLVLEGLIEISAKQDELEEKINNLNLSSSEEWL